MKTRIITATLLFFGFFLAYFYFPLSAWIILVTAIAGAACWEWGRLMNASPSLRLGFVVAIVALCCLLAFVHPSGLGLGVDEPVKKTMRNFGCWLYLPAVCFWLLVAPVWIKNRWSLSKSSPGWVIGIIVILPTWLALIHLRQAGAYSLPAIMGVVWIADVAAYFSGQAFGRRKLAPVISPGKTWEGVIGGGLAVLLYGFVLSRYLPGVFITNYGLLIIVLIFMTIMGILGDLFESLLKRQAGLKDSGNLLPGHGGILDRVDSLTATLPLAALAWLLIPS